MQINATFNPSDTVFSIEFEESEDFKLKFQEVVKDTVYPEYDGEYEVTPKISAQTLDTKDKVLKDDVHILAVPYLEVTNIQGGKTATIAYL